MTNRRRLAFACLPLLALAACGTREVALPYTPTTAAPPPANARPVVALGRVTDARQDAASDPNWIGTIRGGFGNPIRRLDSPVPVSEVVRQGFASALQQRGLLAPSPAQARYEMNVTVRRLDANQYVRREATAAFDVALSDRQGRQPPWTGTGNGRQVDGSIVSVQTGVFASTEDLRQTAQRAMSQAIDDALGQPGFANAIR